MSRAWKPGDAAVVSWSDGAGVRAIWQSNSQWATESARYLNDWQVNARPLVVIDPEDESGDNDISRLCALIGKHHGSHGAVDLGLDWYSLQAALREFADPKPPKPAEPTGLGAVVETDGGTRYVRLADGFWMSEDESQPWHNVNALRVLSLGVTA